MRSECGDEHGNSATLPIAGGGTDEKDRQHQRRHDERGPPIDDDSQGKREQAGGGGAEKQTDLSELASTGRPPDFFAGPERRLAAQGAKERT